MSALRSAARTAYRAANRALSAAGLRLERVSLDFEARPTDSATRAALLNALADGFETWRAGQTTLGETHAFDTRAATAAFFEAWMEKPFRRPAGGSRFNNILWLHLIAKAIRPDVIVDSGTFEGASAWALSAGAPEAATWSFDIDLSQLAHRAPGVRYEERDWAAAPIETPAGGRVLAYFDDHVDQVRRLLEAQDRGVTLALFDDDFPVTSFYRMAPTPAALPKIEFVLDETLADGQTLEWDFHGSRQRFVVDRTYLERARAAIAATERLPFTGLITGIHQTPYRVVRLAA